MKFKTFKIIISIIALIQFTVSSTLENSSNTEIKSTSTIKTSSSNNLKSKMLLKSKSQSHSKSKSKVTLREIYKRNEFYKANGIYPPHFEIPKEEIPDTINQPLVKDPSKVKGENTQILMDWQMISSEAFLDKGKFPDVFIADTNSLYKIKLDNLKFRVNDAHQKIDQQNKNLPHDKNCFWFRLSGLNLYYSSTKSDYNILGAISIEEIIGVISLRGDHTGYHCYIVKDKSMTEWKICSASIEKRNLWVCTIQKQLGAKLESFCPGAEKEEVIVERNVSN
jgi:hypothetical protein